MAFIVCSLTNGAAASARRHYTHGACGRSSEFGPALVAKDQGAAPEEVTP